MLMTGICWIMFYTLVRSLITFHKLQDSIRERKDRTPDGRQQQQSLPKEPEIIVVTFNKVKRSMGLSIVAAKVSLKCYVRTRFVLRCMDTPHDLGPISIGERTLIESIFFPATPSPKGTTLKGKNLHFRESKFFP